MFFKGEKRLSHHGEKWTWLKKERLENVTKRDREKFKRKGEVGEGRSSGMKEVVSFGLLRWKNQKMINFSRGRERRRDKG